LTFQESLRDKISKFDADTLSVRQTVAEQKEKLDALGQETESLREQVEQ
jgi:cell division protein FtsB